MSEKTNYFEVLNPCADADPVLVRGLSPRLSSLKDKKIGLFNDGKPAAMPILQVVERKLKERFPSNEFSYFGPGTSREMATPESLATK